MNPFQAPMSSDMVSEEELSRKEIKTSEPSPATEPSSSVASIPVKTVEKKPVSSVPTIDLHLKKKKSKKAKKQEKAQSAVPKKLSIFQKEEDNENDTSSLWAIDTQRIGFYSYDIH